MGKNSSFSSPGAHILDGKTDKKHASKVTPYIARIYGGVCDVYVCVCAHACVLEKETLALDRVTRGGQGGHVTTSSVTVPSNETTENKTYALDVVHCR